MYAVLTSICSSWGIFHLCECVCMLLLVNIATHTQTYKHTHTHYRICRDLANERTKVRGAQQIVFEFPSVVVVQNSERQQDFRGTSSSKKSVAHFFGHCCSVKL